MFLILANLGLNCEFNAESLDDAIVEVSSSLVDRARCEAEIMNDILESGSWKIQNEK
jgi:predicted small metal-binding protein